MQSINNSKRAINYSHGRWKVEGGGESTNRPVSLFFLRNISEAGRLFAFNVIHRVARTYIHRFRIFGRSLNTFYSFLDPSLHLPSPSFSTGHVFHLSSHAIASPLLLFRLRNREIVPFGKWSPGRFLATRSTKRRPTLVGNMEMLIDANIVPPRDRRANICKITRNDNPLSMVIWIDGVGLSKSIFIGSPVK